MVVLAVTGFAVAPAPVVRTPVVVCPALAVTVPAAAVLAVAGLAVAGLGVAGLAVAGLAAAGTTAGMRGTAGAGAPSGTGTRPSGWRHLRVVGQTATQPSATLPGPSRTGVPGASALPARAARLRGPAATVPLPRIPFVLLVLALLGGGLVCLLVVNTTLGASSFRISQLQSDNANLSLQEQTLLGQVAKERSPQGIEERAYQLGMRTPAKQQHPRPA